MANKHRMNPQLIFTTSLLILSELMPYLPCKSNGFLHAGLNTLHSLQLISHRQFAKFEQGAGVDMDKDGFIGGDRSDYNTCPDTTENDVVLFVNQKQVYPPL